jgi:MFS family permease
MAHLGRFVDAMPSRSFAPFRHRGFRLRWSGAFVSNIGTWMETVALGYHVADTTGKSTWSALVAIGGFLPLALVGPIGGVLADRLSRRLLLITTAAVQMLIAVVLAVGVGQEWAGPGVIALLSLATGSMNALAWPAFQASLPELVPKDEIVAASGLFAIQWNLGRIIGPSLAALVIWAGGVPAALAVNAASFLAVIVAVALIPDAPRERPPRQAMLRSIGDGFRWGWNEAGIRVTWLVQVAAGLIAAPFVAFVPQVATQVFDGDEVTTGFLVTCQGVGAVIAGALIGVINHRIGLRRVLVGAVALIGPALVLYGLAPSVIVAGAGLFVVGGLYLMMFTSYSAVAQTRATPSMLGRVVSTNNMLLGLLYPLGAVAQGLIADRWGIRWVTVGSGVAMLVVVVATRVVRPGFSRPLDHPPTHAEVDGTDAPDGAADAGTDADDTTVGTDTGAR